MNDLALPCLPLPSEYTKGCLVLSLLGECWHGCPPSALALQEEGPCLRLDFSDSDDDDDDDLAFDSARDPAHGRPSAAAGESHCLF